MRPHTYFWPRLSSEGYDLGFVRFGEYHGLGNLLYPWTRSIVSCRDHGGIQIAPTWSQFAIGPILRREQDSRFYFNLFKTDHLEISGIKKLVILKSLDWIDESVINHKNIRGKIVVFSGLKNGFQDVLYEHKYIFHKLVNITEKRHKKGLSFDFSGSITAHVRRGDFLLANRLTDIEWFIDSITIIRKKLNRSIPVFLFSDGTDNELQALFRLGNIKRLSFGSSIADMLAMSQSRILLASKGSTFSAWAAFLGRMPFVWPQRKLGRDMYYEKPEYEIVRNIGDNFPDIFYEYLLH